MKKMCKVMLLSHYKKTLKLENICRQWKIFQNLINVGPLLGLEKHPKSINIVPTFISDYRAVRLIHQLPQTAQYIRRKKQIHLIEISDAISADQISGISQKITALYGGFLYCIFIAFVCMMHNTRTPSSIQDYHQSQWRLRADSFLKCPAAQKQILKRIPQIDNYSLKDP